MNKRDLFRSVAAIAAASALPTVGQAQASAQSGRARNPAAAATERGDQWNLLFITMDDLDGSIPGFMSGRRDVTPNLDALAARSHQLVNNRTVSPICMPSRQAMMTGLYPHRSGGMGFLPIREGVPTLTTLTQKAGYYTGAIHKIDHMQPYSAFPWHYAQHSKDRGTQIYSRGLGVAIAEAQAQNKPFFINCNLNDPHRPFYGSRAADVPDHNQQGPYAIERTFRPDEVVVPPVLEDLPPVRQELAQYWSSIRRADVTIGNVLKQLEESGEAHRTVVVFCSDHGMPFPFSKATCYHHGTLEPMLIQWPGMGQPRRFENKTTNVDLLPTLCDLLGIEAPADLDGRSLTPLLKGEPFREAEHVFTQVDTTANGMSYPMRGVHDDRYSLLFSPFADGVLEVSLESMRGLSYPAMVEAAKTDPALAARLRQYVYGYPLAFYDLDQDPGQRVNLIDAAPHRARIRKMTDALLTHMRSTNDPQLSNLETFLAGGKAVVPQDPERFRIRNGEA